VLNGGLLTNSGDEVGRGLRVLGHEDFAFSETVLCGSKHL
jgi:hypothetical protein